MTYGIWNLPDRTLSLSDWRVEPSNGSAPHTSTYKTTPSDCNRVKFQCEFSRNKSIRQTKALILYEHSLNLFDTEI
jgi:hypothetical protein